VKVVSTKAAAPPMSDLDRVTGGELLRGRKTVGGPS
jgi:hypothetical protein